VTLTQGQSHWNSKDQSFLQITPFISGVGRRRTKYNVDTGYFNSPYNSNIIMAVGLINSKTDRGQSSERSDHNEIDYNSLIMQFKNVFTVKFEFRPILNGLPWRRFALRIQ